ncbi:phage integrase [Serratia fonticola]
MAVRKQPTGKWLCECYPAGREGRRVRKQFATKGEALAFERFTMEEVANKPWLGEVQDRRRLSDLIETWYRAYGITLAGGPRRYKKMLAACTDMGNPFSTEITAKIFSNYRERRLSGEIIRYNKKRPLAPIKPSTANVELAYFVALLNELKRLGEWQGGNPLEQLRPYTTAESEMSYLRVDDINYLISICEQCTNKNVLHIVKICLATGARWSEAENLTHSQLSPYKVTFTKTKGKKNRTVPIQRELYDSLPTKTGRLFGPCYSTFCTLLNKSKIQLPKGQASHVLRHTFASHFMMSGGNILVLQKILGHADIAMTLRYAHFSPNHLEEALRFNPLNLARDFGGKVAAEDGSHHNSSLLTTA